MSCSITWLEPLNACRSDCWREDIFSHWLEFHAHGVVHIIRLTLYALEDWSGWTFGPLVLGDRTLTVKRPVYQS